MKILFIGDVSGKIGQQMVKDYLPRLRQRYKPQAVIVNGENAAANGRGITEEIFKNFLSQGVDCVTMGNHTWANYEIYDFIEETDRLIRPANYPNNDMVPGKGISYLKLNNQILAVINLSGRTHMAEYADPFQVGDELISEAKKHTDHIFIDIHAEVTSEKKALGLYFDGRVSAVIGTHTHVQTNDERILPGGTAFLTDAGMTGYYDGILGMSKETIIQGFRSQLPARFTTPENGRGQLNGCIIETDNETGLAKSIQTIRIDGDTLFMD